jgi:hypothetical protein
MLSWRAEIERFDADLQRRMKEISFHEITGIDFDSSSFTRRALGFPRYGRFPTWRDNSKEWRNRNRDRVNEVARIQQKNWRLANRKKAHERDHKYYLLKKERVKILLEVVYAMMVYIH